MKINEVTTQRITEEEEESLAQRVGYQSDVDYGDVDENFQTIVARMVATGAMTKILHKLALTKIAPKLAAAIPGVGIGMGAFLAYKSYKRGDHVGIVLDLMMGLTGGSVIGFKAFVGLLAYSIWREIYKMVGDLQAQKTGKEGEFPAIDLYDKIVAGKGDEWVDNAARSLYLFDDILIFTYQWIKNYFAGNEMESTTTEVIRAAGLADLTDEELEMAEEIFELTYGKSTEEMEAELEKQGIDLHSKANAP